MASGTVCLHLLVPGTEFQCDSQMLCLWTLSHGYFFFMSGTTLNYILGCWLSIFGELEIKHRTEILNELFKLTF